MRWQLSRIRIDGWLSRSEARTQCGLLGFERRVTELAELATLEKSRYQMFLAAGRSGLIHKTKVTQQLVKCMRNQRSTMKSRSVCATTMKSRRSPSRKPPMSNGCYWRIRGMTRISVAVAWRPRGRWLQPEILL